MQGTCESMSESHQDASRQRDEVPTASPPHHIYINFYKLTLLSQWITFHSGSRTDSAGVVVVVSFMDNPALRPDSEGWKLIDNERIRGTSPPVRSRSGLPELEC